MKLRMCCAIPFVSAICLIISCSSIQVAGPVTESGNPVVSGILVDQNSQVVAGAMVNLIRIGRSTQDTGESSRVAQTTTGVDGAFRFNSVSAGGYRVEGRSPHFPIMALSSIFTVHNTSISIPRITMRPSTKIHGFAHVDGNLRTVVVLAGTPYRQIVSQTGAFTFDTLPQDTFVAVFIIHNDSTGGMTIAHIDTIAALDSGVTYIDTMHISALGSGTGNVLVDDFEDGNQFNVFGSIWWSFNDPNDTNSVVTPLGGSPALISASGVNGSNHCIHISYTFKNAQPLHLAGLGCSFLPAWDSATQCVDMSSAQGVHFWMRGTGDTISMGFRSDLFPNMRAQFLLVPGALQWQSYTCDFAKDMKIISDTNTPAVTWDQMKPYITHLLTGTNTGTGSRAGEIWIDDVTIVYK